MYYRIKYRRVGKIKKFRETTTEKQLKTFANLVTINPINIRNIHLPEFTRFSFVSKILMFLDPQKYVILDRNIMKLNDPNNKNNPITNIAYGDKETSIRITQDSQKHYFEWCSLCKKIASHYLKSEYAVDAERGFFKLVENNELNHGRKIILYAMKDHF